MARLQNTTGSEQLNFRLPRPLADELRRVAAEDDRSMGNASAGR